MGSRRKDRTKQTVMLAALLLFSMDVQARVFNINDEPFSSYFKGSYGHFGSAASLYEGSTPTGVELSPTDAKYLYTGEIGFMMSTRRFSLRVAGEFLNTLGSTAKGSDSGGTELYNLSSKVSAIIPKLGFDMHVKQWTTARLVLSFEAGQATATLTNAYTMTAAGQSQLGTADFSEVATTKAMTYEARLGYESLLSDTTTFHLDIGYRMLEAGAFTVSQEYTGFNGPVTKGTQLQNATGGDRDLNLDGLNIGIGFKFYL